MRSLKIAALFLFAFLINNKMPAQKEGKADDIFPVPSGNPEQLFYLQRTANVNTVIYELNQKNGSLDTLNPIHVFWILYAKTGQHADLSGMEKEFAYGVKIKRIAKEQYHFTLAAYPKITLTLLKGADQKYNVYVTPAKQQMILSRIYIEEKSGVLKPTVTYIEFTGKDVKSGKELTERIAP